MSKEGKRKKEGQKNTVEGGLSKKWRWRRMQGNYEGDRGRRGTEGGVERSRE